MILREHLNSYYRFIPFMKPEMLMLGRQTNTSGWKLPCDYKTLDPDGGDFQADLGEPLKDGGESIRASDLCAWKTVFNLGTLEHIWDIHQAYVNAASMVASNGYFLGQSPVAGWEGHGVHVTEWSFIHEFFSRNGFMINAQWFTTQAGNECDKPKRNGGKSILYWFAAKRVAVIPLSYKPSQFYHNGVKPS